MAAVAPKRSCSPGAFLPGSWRTLRSSRSAVRWAVPTVRFPGQLRGSQEPDRASAPGFRFSMSKVRTCEEPRGRFEHRQLQARSKPAEATRLPDTYSPRALQGWREERSP